MRIFSALALTLCCSLALAGCVSNSVAVVDPSRLFQDSGPGKAGFEHLSRIESAMQAQLEIARKLMEKSPNDEALRERFQKIFLGYQQIVGAEQQKVVERINEVMQKALDDCRARKGYTVILSTEGLLSHDPKADVTNEVLAEMNRVEVTFEPVTLEELSPSGEKAPAATDPAPAAAAPSAGERAGAPDTAPAADPAKK